MSFEIIDCWEIRPDSHFTFVFLVGAAAQQSFNASSGNGRRIAFASFDGARVQTSRSLVVSGKMWPIFPDLRRRVIELSRKRG